MPNPKKNNKRQELIEFGRAFRKLRKLFNYSQDTFAAKANIHRSTIGSIERGEINITYSTILTLAKGFDFSLSAFFKSLEDSDFALQTALRKPD